MSETATPCHVPRARKKKGYIRSFLTLGIVAVLIALASPCLQMTSCGPKHNPATVIKNLEVAITAYETDSAHFPVPESDWHGPDVSIRTRGLIIPVLLGSKEAKALNPKEVKFIDLPAAKDRKSGLWQDGAEWVLSDPWGEPYYIVMDTSGDREIANPECGATSSDTKQTGLHPEAPAPKKLPLKVIIYSSGPDRDPKTWDDNVCSWHPH